MKKLLFWLALSVIEGVIWFTGFPTSVGAQNLAGINIGAMYSHFNQALTTVGPGGWIVLIAGGTNNCGMLQPYIKQANDANVNLVIRGQIGNHLKSYDAAAWVATLGKLETTQKIYFMPWNEPNQKEVKGDFISEQGLKEYTDALLAEADKAGLGGKVIITSPALNITRSDRMDYINNLGGGSYFGQFEVIAMNLYDNGELYYGCPLCNPLAFNNPAKTNEVLSAMGVGGKPAIITESGTDGANFYFLKPPATNSPLWNFVKAYKNQGQYPVAIPSYDLAGEVGHNWSLFNPNAMDTANLLASFLKGGTTPVSFDQAKFDIWLDSVKDSLISCGPCGYASKQNTGLCQGSGPITGGGGTHSVCTPSDLGDRTSRPIGPPNCQACNIGSNAGSCATGFTVNDKVSWQRADEGINCTYAPPVEHLVTTTWGGKITIDPNQITIPFVGKKKDESESKYLADYFDGTNEYYKNYNKYWVEYVSYAGVLRKLTPMTFQDTLKEDMVNRAVRSLNTQAPFEGKIHDYVVTYPTRLCWDVPLIMETSYDIWNEFNLISLIYKKLGVPIPSKEDWFHHCLFNNSADQALEIDKIGLILRAYNASPLGKLMPIDVRYYSMGFIPIPPFSDLEGHKKLSEVASHLPPSVDDPDYEIKWAAWKKSTWGNLWEAVPMVSREDTEGQIQPYLGSKSGDEFKNLDDTGKNQIESVPHVARLYESSKIVSSILTPYNEPVTTAQNSNSKNPLTDNSSTNNNSLTGLFNPKPVQAAVPPPCQRYCTGNMTFYDIDAPTPGQHSFKSYFCVPCPAGQTCDGISHLLNLHIYDSGGASGLIYDTRGAEVQCPNGKWETQWGTNYHPSTVNMNVGDSFTVSASWEKASGGSRANCCVDGGSASCTITLAQNADGTYKWDTLCGIAPPIQPTCFQDPASPVDSCIKKDAITGTGDTLCCSNIQYKLTAVDKFSNNKYTACTAEVDNIQCHATHWVGAVGQTPPGSYDDWRDVGDPCENGVNCTAIIFGHPSQITDVECRPHGKKIITDNKCYQWVGNKGDPANEKSSGYTDPADVSRQIGISLQHPYLEDIWNQTAGPQGVFNNFRPSFHPSFPDTPAYSEAPIGYTPYSDQIGWCSGIGSKKSGPKDCTGGNLNDKGGFTTPTTGQFYFPHLGGIQQGKQWTTNMLVPLK